MNKLSGTFAPIALFGSRVIPKWSKQLQKRKLIVKTLGGEEFMNSCCVLPVEKIACNEHLTNGECCLVTDATEAPATAPCAVSQTVGRKIQRRTMESLLKPYARALMEPVQYYYCADPNCKIVYFSQPKADQPMAENESVQHFTVDDVSVKVLAKDKGDDVNVCYCFNWTRARIREEHASMGKSTASLQIAKEVKAGNCFCDIKNPKGECCLGDVNTFVKSLSLTDTPS